MIDSLYIGATGMNAEQARINSVAGNVSNVSTFSYKKTRVSFEDVYSAKMSAPSFESASTAGVSLGTRIARSDQILTQGDLVKTANALDVAIQGNGYLEVMLPNGKFAYTRMGSLSVNADGELMTQSQHPLSTRIMIPQDTTDILISSSGEVSVLTAGNASSESIGQLELANFANPAGLEPLGSGLYATTEESGTAELGIPGEESLGQLRQGFLEASNVDLVEELVELVVAQRAFQMNSKVVQISDDILSTINSLRR